MKIMEMTVITDKNGALTIPTDILREIGIGQEERLKLAWLSKHDEQKVAFKEFFISQYGFDISQNEFEPENGLLKIPAELLDAAEISDFCDVTIICIEGAIIIAREDFDGLDMLIKSTDFLAEECYE